MTTGPAPETQPVPAAAGPPPGPHVGEGRRGLRPALLAFATVLALALGALGGYAAARLTTGAPSEHSAEAGFARDMQTHHAQAVELAFIMRDRTDDPEVRTLTFDIATSQQHQIGQMYAWLVEWGLPQTGADPTMAWMGTADGEGHLMGTASSSSPTDAAPPMPGMATPAQLATLRAAKGVDAERQFLTLMIAHHKGGVVMAEAVLKRTGRGDVRTLAQAIVAAQKSEIDAMTAMLAART